MGVVGIVVILEGFEGWIGRGAERGRVIIVVVTWVQVFSHVSLYCNMGSYSVAYEAKRSEAKRARTVQARIEQGCLLTAICRSGGMPPICPSCVGSTWCDAVTISLNLFTIRCVV